MRVYGMYVQNQIKLNLSSTLGCDAYNIIGMSTSARGQSRWKGKVVYSQLLLGPSDAATLLLLAKISLPGVRLSTCTAE